MKVRVAEVFKQKDTIDEILDILQKEYLLSDQNEEMLLADFIRVDLPNPANRDIHESRPDPGSHQFV